MIENRCVYLHKLDGVVVYVGSGSVQRMKVKSCRSKEHLATWDKLEFEIVSGGMSKQISLKVEQALIDAYLPIGNLFNKVTKISDTNVIKYADIADKFILTSDSPSWLRWKRRNGSVAGTLVVDRGYYRVKMGKTTFPAHRLVWVLSNKKDLPADLVVDHIDRNASNNSPDNLRAVSQSDNCKNREHSVSNTGLRYIYEKGNGFHVKLKYGNIWKTKCFYYGKRFQKEYDVIEEEARGLALEMAVKFRDKFVEL